MRKRLLLILLALCTSLVLLPRAAWADTSGKCGDNLTWTYNNGTLTIQGTGEMYNYEPSEDGNTMPWAGFVAEIKTATIGNGVTSIGDEAFWGGTNLTKVTIPGSVAVIGYDAFSGCSSLTSITIPNSVTTIEGGAFSNCSGLTSITIPNSVTSIGVGIFSGCSGLTSITIPDNFDSIGSSMFSDCSGLTRVTIPESVTTIEWSAFRGCSNLTSMTIPESVTTIEGMAFMDCLNLTDVYYGGIRSQWNQIYINSYTYLIEGENGNTPLLNANIHYNIEGVPTSGECGDNLTWSFSNGTLTIKGAGSMYDYEHFDDFGNYFRSPWYDLGNEINSVKIGNGVTDIGGYAFAWCENLTGANIPDSVVSISEGAFAGCSSLTSVIIPDSVVNIDRGVFSGCSNLPSVAIPDGIVTIYWDTFASCDNLSSVAIPKSVTTIEPWAFGLCNSLKDVYYGGSEDQWNQIEILEDYENGNTSLLNATIHYNADLSVFKNNTTQNDEGDESGKSDEIVTASQGTVEDGTAEDNGTDDPSTPDGGKSTFPVVLIVIIAVVAVAGVVVALVQKKKQTSPAGKTPCAAKATPVQVEGRDESASGVPNFCTNCGCPVEPGAVFCIKCGHDLKEQS